HPRGPRADRADRRGLWLREGERLGAPSHGWLVGGGEPSVAHDRSPTRANRSCSTTFVGVLASSGRFATSCVVNRPLDFRAPGETIISPRRGISPLPTQPAVRR